MVVPNNPNINNNDKNLETVQNTMLPIINQDILQNLNIMQKQSRIKKKNMDEKIETVQNTMLPIINQDLLLYLKDSKYVDINNI